MKRTVIIAGIAILAAFQAHAIEIDLSAGAGLRVSSINRNATADDVDIRKWNATRGFITPELFIDATYLEASFGYALMLGGSAKYILNGDTILDDPINERYAYFTMGFLGKYPFDVSGIRVFPLLGCEFLINTLLQDADGNDLREGMTDEEIAYLNSIWISAGAGADIDISKDLYIRPKIVIGFAFLNGADRDEIDAFEAAGAEYSIVKFKVELGAYVGYNLKKGISLGK